MEVGLACETRYAPPGIPVYLEQVLEKEGGFAVGTFPEGWVLSQHCHIQGPICISLSHTVHDREIWIFVKNV